MELPSLIHPKTFNHNGALFRVATYKPVSDAEARQIVLLHLQGNPGKFPAGNTYTLCYNNESGTFLT